MHILGLCNGSINGNSEILLKAALLAAKRADSSITLSWIHTPSASVPRNARPLSPAAAGKGVVPSSDGPPITYTVPDDRDAVRNAILDADALIFATPTYSHQPPGALKALTDTILGPFADAAMAKRIDEGRKAGNSEYQNATFDERLLKPRVVGFIATAGSTLSSQITMALPTLHQIPYCLHAKVVDQHVFQGYAIPGSVLLDEANTISRAEKLGENVASQMGKAYDDAQYLGPTNENDCPYCHLSKIDIDYTQENDVGCITCGHRGKLVVGNDGRIKPIWDVNGEHSCITLEGKHKHLDDIMGKVAEEVSVIGSVQAKKAEWGRIEIQRASMPSLGAKL
jgi:multimeric flavodoxin WrbA